MALSNSNSFGSPKCGASQSDATGNSARIRQGFEIQRAGGTQAGSSTNLLKISFWPRFSSEAIVQGFVYCHKMNCLESFEPAIAFSFKIFQFSLKNQFLVEVFASLGERLLLIVIVLSNERQESI